MTGVQEERIEDKGLRETGSKRRERHQIYSLCGCPPFLSHAPHKKDQQWSLLCAAQTFSGQRDRNLRAVAGIPDHTPSLIPGKIRKEEVSKKLSPSSRRV